MVIGGLTVVAGLAVAVAWSSAEGEEVVIEPFTFSCDSAVGRRTKVVRGWRYELPKDREWCLQWTGNMANVCRRTTDTETARILSRPECVAGFHKQVGRCVAHSEAQREKCGGAPRVVDITALGDAKRRAIQAALVSNGFSLGRIDGKFGPKTRKSVREWQSKAGHAVTGELTSEQIRELLKGREARSVSTPSSATAQNSGDLTTKSIRWDNGAVYHGQTRYGKPHGRGVMTWSKGKWKGNRHEGEYRDGKRHGRGVFTFASGNRYEGDYRDNKQHGHGVATWSNGDRYEGGVRNGTFHGRGILTEADGSRYEGEYRDGSRHGRGVYTEPDGSRYEGYWRGDSKHGRGKFTFADGNSFTQEWRGAKAHDVYKPRSPCLEVKWESGTFVYWINRCSVGIDVAWHDEGACQSTPGNTYTCGAFVGANKKVLAVVEGHVSWHECKSPGGHGDVIPMEKNGTAYCLDSPTSRTQARWNAQERRFQQAVLARLDREEEEWDREQERTAAERRRRNAETWNSIGRTLKTLQQLKNSSGSTGSGSGSGRRCPPGMKAATCEPGYPCRPEHTVKTAC